MNKYRDKSDFEINKDVAECLKQRDYIDNYIFHNGVVCIADSYGTSVTFDPCNNPTDAMPIVIENGISSLFNGDEWICSALDGEFLSINENLYRAGCEVFLMMKDAESEKV